MLSSAPSPQPDASTDRSASKTALGTRRAFVAGVTEAITREADGRLTIVLFGPLLFPIARQLGVHEVHYAMVVVLSTGVGLFAPRFRVGCYAACAISRIDPEEGLRPIAGYMAALLVGTLIVAAVPWISTGFLK